MDERRELRLGDVITIRHGYAFKGEYFSDTGPGPLLLTPGNFSIGGGFKAGKSKYYLGSAPESYRLKPGDLVVTMTDLSKSGDTLGYPALIPDGVQYLHNQRVGLVHIDNIDLLERSYLYYALQNSNYRDHILAGATGSTVRHTSPSRIYEYTLSVPSIHKQRAIAAILRALDGKIVINEKIAEASHKLAGLQYADTAQEQCEVSLSTVAVPILGATPNRTISAYWSSGNPWASAKDVTASKFGTLIKTEEEVSDLAIRDTKAKPVPKGSVILTARGTLGAVARVAQPTSLNQSCYAFTPGPLPPAVLYLTVRAAALRMLSIAHGTVFSTVNMKTFDHVRIHQLTATQIQRLEDASSPLLETIESRIRENQALAKLRDTLLPKLMSGELRVRDAEKVVEEAT